MRASQIHQFLKWAGRTLVVFISGCLALVAAFAAVYSGVREWAEGWYGWAEPVVTSGWFVAVCVLLILGYIGALVRTGTPIPQTTEKEPMRISVRELYERSVGQGMPPHEREFVDAVNRSIQTGTAKAWDARNGGHALTQVVDPGSAYLDPRVAPASTWSGEAFSFVGVDGLSMSDVEIRNANKVAHVENARNVSIQRLKFDRNTGNLSDDER